MKHLLRVMCLCGAVFSPGGSFAQNLAPLSAEDRTGWAAVGTLAGRLGDIAKGCSATLLAADLVVTAAHCTTDVTGLLSGLRFVAGHDGTRRVAESWSTEITRHPGYESSVGMNRVRYDIAVIRLGRLIPASVARPATLTPEDRILPDSALLLGYQDGPDIVLHGHFPCALEAAPGGEVLKSACTVVFGNSGGAVMTRGDSGWLYSGLVVARVEPEGSALVVPVDPWLREEVRKARLRASERSAAGATATGQ